MADVDAFIARWKQSGASERANFQPFLVELCEVIGVAPPDPAGARAEENTYCFERGVRYAEEAEGQRGLIDLYRKDAFVMEAKQGSDAPAQTEKEELTGEKLRRKMGTARRGTPSWAQAMTKAKHQARRYARALPADDGWPPFLAVVDVGHCIDLYADFARQGKTYTQFPDAGAFRIELEDLRRAEVRERLRLLWTDPLALDPSRRSARVTRDLAEKLGRLASALEDDSESSDSNAAHDPDTVAQFLMRCLFTMFAEDVGLLPEDGFTRLLKEYRGERLDVLPEALADLWQTMDEGGFAGALGASVKQFNGALFSDHRALALTEAQRELLQTAAEADWSDVEPAIFGTLLERALDPRERHRLGAHYTPRAYVERLVQPTVVQPLREEWEAAQAAAARLEADDENEAAIGELRAFHERLCTVKVLDPACGSGNFLYVTLEHLKRLEAEVLQTLDRYGVDRTFGMTGGRRVGPDQLLGLELNPRAARIADVVLWIGYLQWHVRTTGSADRLDPPILQAYGNIEQRDALITYDGRTPRTDEDGQPVTRWDRRTMKRHPTTGDMVPDETATEPVYDYHDPEAADWPAADFIVGNPPFIGAKDFIESLGEGYTDALRDAYYRRVPQSADFVMFWWYRAANLVRKERPERFGFITTNSVRQTFNRRVMKRQMGYKNAVRLAFAIPDHPWVASSTGAAVRIAMTVGTAADGPDGMLQTVTREADDEGIHHRVELAEAQGTILPDLTIGPDVAGTEALEANEDLACAGMKLHGAGFIVEPEKAEELGLGEVEGLEQHIRPYRNGRDLTQRPREVKVIDLYGLEKEEARERFPEVYQYVRDRVKPERDAKADRGADAKKYAEDWWLFGKTRPTLRSALEGLSRYVATVETSKHVFFQFLDASILPDNMLINVASDDAFDLGVLSSHIHEAWTLAAGGTLEDRKRYTKTRCFDPFPFPAATEEQRDTIRACAERLDAHRKERLAAHPDALTMTDLYNALEKARSSDALTEDERATYEQGLVGVLAELHDELDAAVAAAYGWPADLPDEEILYRLVDLNAERRAEEEQGHVRWLRPSYQAPEEAAATHSQGDLGIETPVPAGDGAPAAEKPAWGPLPLAARMKAIQQILATSDGPRTVEEVAARFQNAPRATVRDLLDTLAALGQAEEAEDGRFAA